MREIDKARIFCSLDHSPSNRLLRGGTRCRRYGADSGRAAKTVGRDHRARRQTGRAGAPRPPQRRRQMVFSLQALLLQLSFSLLEKESA